MSDFDKEAEREKLREQLEREEEVREATQHMSDLLLKGATMTNKHCDECGDPVFRYQGQEFCPTCGQDIGEADDAEAAADAADAASAADAQADANGGAVGQAAVAENPALRGQSSSVDSAGRSATGGEAAASAPSTHGGAAADNLEAARAALVRKLSTLARQAEATDDVGRSRELLAAAREAAEALAAVDKARR